VSAPVAPTTLRRLFVTLAASLVVTFVLGALLIRSGSPLKPARRTAFEPDPAPVTWAPPR
jgi:hypothetical protein